MAEETRTNPTTGVKEHRHSGHEDWHPIETKHRDQSQREQIASNPNQSKKPKSSDGKPGNTPQSDSKWKSFKDKCVARAKGNGKFKVPKFSAEWCLSSAFAGISAIFDKSIALYDKYKTNKGSKGYKITQHISDGYENAMNKIDQIYPIDREQSMTFDELKDTRKQLIHEYNVCYENAGKIIGKDAQSGLELLKNLKNPEYAEIVKKHPELYAIREEAIVYYALSKQLREKLVQSAEGQQRMAQINSGNPQAKPKGKKPMTRAEMMARRKQQNKS